MITILGPTASGKTALACAIANKIDGEILSADSRQVYRGMDIGTGKDLNEFEVKGNKIPYHLIDLHDAGYEYNVFQYQNDFLKAYNDVIERKKMPILCGGSGLYLDAVLKGYRMVEVPQDDAFRTAMAAREHEDLIKELQAFGPLHNDTDITSKKRTIRALEIARHCKDKNIQPEPFPQLQSTLIGIHFERQVIRDRITKRLKQRLKAGMVEEVKGLLDSGIPADKLKFYGLEYKFITMFITGEIDEATMVERLNIGIHQFAKRQMTWFRRMEKQGFLINWIDGSLTPSKKLAKLKGLVQF